MIRNICSIAAVFIFCLMLCHSSGSALAADMIETDAMLNKEATVDKDMMKDSVKMMMDSGTIMIENGKRMMDKGKMMIDKGMTKEGRVMMKDGKQMIKDGKQVMLHGNRIMGKALGSCSCNK